MEMKKYLAGILSVAILSTISLSAVEQDTTCEESEKVVKEAASVLGVSEQAFEDAIRDEVVANSITPGKAKTFWKEYRKPIVIGAATLVVASGGYYGGKRMGWWGKKTAAVDPGKEKKDDKADDSATIKKGAEGVVDYDAKIAELQAEYRTIKGKGAVAKKKAKQAEIAELESARDAAPVKADEAVAVKADEAVAVKADDAVAVKADEEKPEAVVVDDEKAEEDKK